MKFLFWLSFFVIFYAYAGYPILLFLVSRFFKKPVRRQAGEPTVSIILSAFNEENSIEWKLLNLIELNYPPEKLEILVGSDGASDQTDEIISRFRSSRLRFYRFVKNLGKPHVLNALAAEATGSVLVFTDARQELDPQAIRALVANFEDPVVGCVSGELYFQSRKLGENGSVSQGMGLYWAYEKWLRRRESEIGSMLGATGAIYAIRKNLFPELPEEILVDDMYVPLSIVEKKYRAVFESGAKAYDRVSEYAHEEFRRKVRTLAGNYQIFSHFFGLFQPWKSPIAWQLFSHKFLRLTVPFFLAGLFVSNLFFLRSPIYGAFFLGQVLFYAAACLGGGLRGLGALPRTFCVLNYSAAVALFKFLTQGQRVTWEKAYV